MTIELKKIVQIIHANSTTQDTIKIIGIKRSAKGPVATEAIVPPINMVINNSTDAKANIAENNFAQNLIVAVD